MGYDLQTFGLREMIEAGRCLRHAESAPRTESACMEEAASSVVDFFYDGFVTEAAGALERNCVLARCFKTHAFGDLPPGLQQRAARNGAALSPETQCLTLLATRGQEAAWNSRHHSRGHQAIPLATVEMVAQAPMIRQLILQLGIAVTDVVTPVPRAHSADDSFGVFFVEEAQGSEMVPDQQAFVERYGVRSVLGFGGLLPAGELFAVVLFTRVPVAPQTAALFRTLALGVKLTLLPFSGKQIFMERTWVTQGTGAERGGREVRVQPETVFHD